MLTLTRMVVTSCSWLDEVGHGCAIKIDMLVMRLVEQ